jgi:hypothetical protein
VIFLAILAFIKKIEVIFSVLVIFSFCLSFTAEKSFAPIDAKFSELASDAVEGAVSTFLSPLKEISSNDPVSEYQPHYNIRNNFLYPSIMYLLSTILMIIALYIFYKRDWNKNDKKLYSLNAFLFFFTVTIGVIFSLKGIKYLAYSLFHSIIFLGVTLFLVLGLLWLVREVLNSKNA